MKPKIQTNTELKQTSLQANIKQNKTKQNTKTIPTHNTQSKTKHNTT